ncbi:DUF3040 domain-containing protein [Geodermatophilus sp. SYSU D00742]
MDDDPVLRELGEDLAREDPRLAALLRDGPGPPARHRAHRRTGAGALLVLLAAVAVGVVAPLALGLHALGVIGMLLVLASPVVVLWAARPPVDGPP